MFAMCLLLMPTMRHYASAPSQGVVGITQQASGALILNREDTSPA